MSSSALPDRVPSASSGAGRGLPGGITWQALLLTTFVFVLFSALAVPMPGVNEPHYLTKSRHFWNPDWCGRDLFLQSADAHVVYYATFGILAELLPFSVAAWIGRLCGWILLAAGWTALASQLAGDDAGSKSQPGRVALFAGCSAAGLALLSVIGNLSGEWLLGGTEAKVFSYTCVFWSLAGGLAGRPILAAAGAGLAVSLHPVIGGWHLVAALWASLLPLPLRVMRVTSERSPPTPWSTWLVAGLVLGITAAPGLVPAVLMLGGASPEEGAFANRIQVYYRLAHHLNPARFPVRGYVCYTLLLIGWLVLHWTLPRTARDRFWGRYLWGTILIAGAGAVATLGWTGPPERWLRFYPFRMIDLFLPIAFCFAFAKLLIGDGQVWRMRVAAGALVLFLAIATGWGWATRGPRGVVVAPDSDLAEMYRWIQAETPPDALFRSLLSCRAMKWYAERAEYVSYKDMPQDAAHIVEWDRCIKVQLDWNRKYEVLPGALGYTQRGLTELREATGIDYVITTHALTRDVPPVFRNRTYVIYPTSGAPR